MVLTSSAGDHHMVVKAKLFFLLKTMGPQKLGLDLINQYQMAMILVVIVKKIMAFFVLVIF